MVSQLKCKVCSEFMDRIRGSKNFSDKWIVGADSVRVSNVRDHVQSNQHAHAMMLLKKQRAKSAGLSPSTYAPIAQAFTALSNEERGKLRFKFDITHFVATEKLPFIKYPQICELESHHGVNLGTSYINETAGKEMIHYIAESRRQELRQKLAKAKFFLYFWMDQQMLPTSTMKLFLLCVVIETGAMRRFTHEWSTSQLCDLRLLQLKASSRCWRLHCRALASRRSRLRSARSCLGYVQMVLLQTQQHQGLKVWLKDD